MNNHFELNSESKRKLNNNFKQQFLQFGDMEEIYSKMFHAQYNQQGALLGTRFFSTGGSRS